MINIRTLCDEYSLMCRLRNLDKQQYTHRENSRKGIVLSRLDYWLTSSKTYMMTNVSINIGKSSDNNHARANRNLTKRASGI